jgi:hypothetical protein
MLCHTLSFSKANSFSSFVDKSSAFIRLLVFAERVFYVLFWLFIKG